MKRLQRLEKLASILDNAIPIPGTEFRIGLDPIVGLIPGFGDGVTTLLGGLIVIEAARMGAPKRHLLRMLGNLLMDSMVGAVPILGDIFDAGYKANQRNVEILKEIPNDAWLDARDARSIALLILGLVGIIVLGSVFAAFYLFTALLSSLS